jgi:dTDP-4-dehydrorhamnose reductase
MLNKRILLTGSNGLLGQKIVHLILNETKHELLATSKGLNRIISRDDINYQSLDITDFKQLEKVVSAFRPDAIINTAAMTNVDACESQHKECWSLNVTAVENLVKVSNEFNIHLVHLSTDFVFDGEKGPYSEEDEPNPLSLYGRSKWESEKIVINSGLERWSIARTIIVYGVVENMSRSNVVLWAKGALEKGEPINVVDDQFRSPTYALDLAKGCLSIVEKEKSGIFHLSGKDLMSIIELVYRVADYYGLDKSRINPIKSAVLNQAAKRPPYTGFNLTKANELLDYDPLSFEEGLDALSKELDTLN